MFRITLLIILTLLVAACRRHERVSHAPMRFEILEQKVRAQKTSYGGANISVTGIIRAVGPIEENRNVMLLLECGISFKSSGVADTNEETFVLRDGSGMLEIDFYLSKEEAETVGGEVGSPILAWSTIGCVPLEPAVLNSTR